MHHKPTIISNLGWLYDWGYDPKYTFKPTFYIAFPLLALFFVFMAYKGIKADERLVKSLDRIR